MSGSASQATVERPPAPIPAAGEQRDRPSRRIHAGPVETIALAVLPIAWLSSTASVLEQDWLWAVTGAVLSMALVAALVRSVWPRFAATAAAIVVGVGWITVVSAPDDALLGVVPTPDAFRETMAVLGDGIQSIAWALRTPILAEGAVLAAIVAAAVVLAVFVDLLGHALRAPALAVLFAASPLLLPIAFRADAPWWHALPGVAATALVLAAPTIDEGLEVGRGWLGPVALVAVAALVSAAVPLVAPSPREVDLDLPSIEELLRTPTPVLRTDIDLGDELRRPEAQQVFTYSTSDGLPTVTRLMTLPDAGDSGFVTREVRAGSPDVLVEGADLGVPMQQTVRMRPVRAEALPSPERAAGISAPAGTHWDDANDALRLEGGVDTADLEYTAAGTRSPDLAALAGSSSSGHDEHLALPDAAAGIGAQGAALVTGEMGVSDRIRAVHAFMTSGVWNYSETLDLPGFGGAGGDGWAALEGFLETRSGYCVHYASATAALLRGAGVPTRVVVGFLGGDTITGGWSVSTNHMHAWAEAWVDGAGWVRVETTPGAGTGVASPEGDQQTTEPTPSPTPSASPSPAPSASPSASPSAAPTAAPTPSAPGTSGEGGRPVIDAAALRAWLLALGVLLVLALPWLVRRVQRAVRMRGGPPGAWQELRATLADAGVRLPGSATPGEVQAAIVARVAAAARRDGPVGGAGGAGDAVGAGSAAGSGKAAVGASAATAAAALAAVDRVRLAAERAAFDAGPRDREAVEADTALVRRALIASQPWWRRALTTVVPPSLLRVVPPMEEPGPG